MNYLLGKVAHRSKDVSIRPYLGKTPQLHDSVFLADGVRILGDVTIQKESNIWFNVVIRGDVHNIEIGEQTNIQDSAVIHCTFQKFSTKIGHRVSIAHLAMIHGCVIEDEVLVGMQAIIMDGVRIGRGSIIGAGSLVTQGTQIPENSLVLGSPAKVIRPVSDAERAGVLATTLRYLEYTKGYSFAE